MKNDLLVRACPFTVLIDRREKAPYPFTGIRSDAAQGRRLLVIPSNRTYLKTGDYTVAGMEEKITVERKSLEDLFSTLGQHRERFEREHERMAEMRRAAVVIEASWWEILQLPPGYSKLNPKVVFRTSLSWFVRYGVPWFAVGDRRLSEVFTFRFLEKAWKEFSDDQIDG